jgi:hypothetical protein
MSNEYIFLFISMMMMIYIYIILLQRENFLQVKKFTCIEVEMIVLQFFNIFNKTTMNCMFLFIMKNCKHEPI